MANTSSDGQLRKQLTNLGVDVGPITDTTRHVYQKRLEKLLAEKKSTRRQSQLTSVSSLGHSSSNDSDSENVSSTSRVAASRKTPSPAGYRRSPRLSVSNNSASSSTASPRHGNDPPGSSPVLRRPGRRSSSRSSLSEELGSGTPMDSRIRTRYNHLDHRMTSLSETNQQARTAEYSQITNDAAFGYSNPSESRTSNYQWVSMALPIFSAIFFIILGLLYLGVHQNNKQEDFIKSLNINYTLCEVKKDMNNCIPQRKFRKALDISRRLFDTLSNIAGKYECGHASSRILSASEIYNILEVSDLQGDGFLESITLMFLNPGWGLRLYNERKKLLKSLNETVSYFESSVASKTFFCRFKQVMFQLSLVVVLIASTLIVLWCVKLYKTRKEEERFKLYNMVDKILTILKETAENSEGMELGIPRVHVRDWLIHPSERKMMMKLWLQAVDFIENNESRVRTEKQQIQGESFVVWKWLSQGEQKAKLWQGKAFENSGPVSNTLPFVPSLCLKIRNVFDPDVEYHEDWPVYIQNAILEECDGISGIVHLRVDPLSKEGCVYMKCSTLNAAGQAYKALHGWCFDGNLVTVKYLHLERYYERFPEAQYCTESLKPSHTLRLSMSRPPMPNPLESL